MRYTSLSLLLLTLMAAPAATPATLLTNGAPFEFGLPGVPASTVLNGDFGYAIYVPPGASQLTVKLTASVEYSVDLLVRYGVDVGPSGTAGILADFRSAPGTGPKEIVITTLTSPALTPGTYFIGFNVVTPERASYVVLLAEVSGGSVAPVRAIARSNFDNDLDGWVRNSAASSLPGATQGEAGSSVGWIATGGNRGGYLRFDEASGANTDALVAPAKFLGNLSNLTEGRFEFDFKLIAGPDPNFGAEIRIFGANSAYSWVGPVAPLAPDSPPEVPEGPAPCPPGNSIPPCPNPNPYLGPGPERWRRYTALLQEHLWYKIAGPPEVGFGKVLANVERIEVHMDVSFGPESNGLDNFALLTRGPGPAQIVLPGNTSFASGDDGWSRNYPGSSVAGATLGDAESTVRWVPFEGNPNGYVRLTDAGGAGRDAVVAPARFLGNLLGITNPQIEFDYRHASSAGATLPVEVRISGGDATFAWTGAVPGPAWSHYLAPLTEALWQRVSGTATFASVLANVERIEISMDQSSGPEINAVDNFWLLPSSSTPAPPSISANPITLTFASVASGGNPASKPVSVTSIGGGGGAVSFNAVATSNGTKNWLRLSANRGTTPVTLNAWADIQDLPPGTYTGLITVVPVGQNIGTQTVPVTLALVDQRRPKPRINYPSGAVSSATNRPQLSPGGLGTLYGVWLGPERPVRAGFVNGTLSLPTTLQGVRVLVNETYGALIGEAPILYAGETQINFQLPFETFGRSEVLLVVDNNGAQSEPHAVQVTSSAPGIFTWAAGRAVAVNENGAVNESNNPAIRGSILTVYMTGQGVVTPSLPSGSAASSRPLTRAPLPSQAWIGGVPAQILFLGMTPQLVGVLQANVIVPEGAPSGDSPLMINIGGWTSNAPVVTVQ